MAANRALIRASLKGLLRAASKLESVSAPLPADLAKLVAAAQPASTLKNAVLTEFRRHKDVQPAKAGALVDNALTALVVANKAVAALSKPVEAKPEGVSFSVGQVFRHKIFGYRAVIVGWDERCKASRKWIGSTGSAKLPHGTEQPYYHCLVDVRDRPSAQISYVAQDNIDLMTPVSASSSMHADPIQRMVIHPLLTRHFEQFNVAGGFYVPTARVLENYPQETPTRVRSLRASGAVADDSESDSDDTQAGKSQRASTLV